MILKPEQIFVKALSENINVLILFNNLNIKIKEVSVTIKTNNNKILVENKYFPLNINLINKESILNKVIKVLRNLSPCPYPVREGGG